MDQSGTASVFSKLSKRNEKYEMMMNEERLRKEKIEKKRAEIEQ